MFKFIIPALQPEVPLRFLHQPLPSQPRPPRCRGETALHVAAEQNRVEVLKELLAAGAAKEVPNYLGRDPRGLFFWKRIQFKMIIL